MKILPDSLKTDMMNDALEDLQKDKFFIVSIALMRVISVFFVGASLISCLWLENWWKYLIVSLVILVTCYEITKFLVTKKMEDFLKNHPVYSQYFKD